MRGGRREGAGRPQGARNKRTRDVEAAMKAVAEEFAEAVPNAFTGDSVAFLQTVYKDPKLPLGMRMDAAAKAARFERPMLTSTNVRLIRSIAGGFARRCATSSIAPAAPSMFVRRSLIGRQEAGLIVDGGLTAT